MPFVDGLGLGDAVIRMNGCDYITFDAIDLATVNQGIEYGYFTHKPNGTNGSQNVIIKNCNIDLTKGTSPYVCGIYISNGPTIPSSASGVVVTSNSGRNENITLTGNTISDVNIGIFCRGFYDNSDFYDQNYIIGIAGEGNTIQNFGGGVDVNSYGVQLYNINNVNIDNNTINNLAGGGTAVSIRPTRIA